jgi:gliding motility-associated-like protein
MMRKLALIVLTVAASFYSQAQLCSIVISPSDTTVCPGDSVHIVSIPVLLNGNQAFNFNNSSIPTGWSATGGTFFSTPCGQNPSGSPYYWAQTAAVTPGITTAAYDVSCGGYLIFDMKMAIQGQASPCEGPDEQDEGISLQYSLNGGLNWVDIIYYSPGGFTLPSNPGGNTSIATGATAYTTWGTYTVNIPPAAQTSNTRFRWVQTASSSSANDNWGLDNIIVNATGAPCGNQAVVNWSNGLMDTTDFWIVSNVDTVVTAYVYDTMGNFMCASAPIPVYIYQDLMTHSLVDVVTSQCPTTDGSAQVTAIGNSIAPYTVFWPELNSTQNPVTLPTNGESHDTTLYHMILTDGCGYTRLDSVLFIVNQTLNIDSVFAQPTSACDDDGVVVALVSGVTGQPLYRWNGPGATNPLFVNSTVWQNRPAGWYYFEVSDNVCSDSDSVYVDVLNPPVATFTTSDPDGCAPHTVTFTNTSVGTTNFFWDFGNGNFVNVTTLDPIAQTYNANANVMLIASNGPNCSDTAYATISVQICGCTDPLALNYNPLAQSNDGSCIYPNPVVQAPNVITPDGDNVNDIFELDMLNVQKMELTITNRWGNVMFKGNSSTWDAKVGGKIVTEGVYFYQYTATGTQGEEISGHGFFNVVTK